MRCKNCGTNNDDNRYICENCGSPLYDEAEIDEINDSNATKTFGAVTDNTQNQPARKAPESNNRNDDDYSKSAEKKSIIVIAILAVVLVAIIVSVVLVAKANKGNNKPSAESSSSTISTSAESTTDYTTEPTTESTTESTTKETTTETTTKQTTTELKTYSIKLISKGGGTVEGAGTYEEGSNVTIAATPDGDYEFDGWYSNGEKISSSTVYSFTATKNISISAVFTEITTTEESVEEINGGLE